jgi:uncharacterized protein (TIGR02284 family)
MTSGVETTLATLNTLIQACRDGEHGFRTAAQHVETPELRQLFAAYADQRRDFAAELEAEVRRLGGEPSGSGSVLGSLHRGWMGVRSTVRPVGDDAIVAECLRGEEAARKAYESAVAGDVAAAVRLLIQRQLVRIAQAHERIRELGRAA